MRIYYNGPVITMEEENMFPESVVTDGDKIVFAGSFDEALERYPNAEIYSLDGHTLLPGFIDTHCHMSFAGEILTEPDVFNCTSVKEVTDRLKEEAEKLKKGDILFINGYEGMPIKEGRNLTLKEMDDAVPDFPLFLRTASTHGTLLNSRALKLLRDEAQKSGFNLKEEDIKDGYIINEANLFAYSIAPNLMNEEQVKKAQDYIIRECVKYGITALHTMEGRSEKNDPDVLSLLERKDSLPFEVRIYYQTTDVDEVVEKGLGQIGGCFNCILDGDLDPGTAAFREAYINNPDNYGKLYFTDERLEDFFTRANDAGLQICMHAIGDRAIEQALDTYEKVLRKKPSVNHRHRIEHFEVCAPDLIEKASDLGIVLAMQPVFDYYWPLENYALYIGKERAKWKCALAPVLKENIAVGGGSDWPVTPPNPFLGIHGAVNHSSEFCRISVMDALKLYTVNAAYLGFAEDRMGSIKAGKDANLVIVSKNPLEEPLDKLDKIEVLETVYRGNTVWKKERGGEL